MFKTINNCIDTVRNDLLIKTIIYEKIYIYFVNALHKLNTYIYIYCECNLI